MMKKWTPWMVCLAVLSACDDTVSPVMRASDTGEVDNCPDDMIPAQSARLLIDYMMLNWINLYPTYNHAGIYSGSPATCVRSDGFGLRQVFEINGKPYGTITIQSNAVGTIDLPTFTGTLVVDLHGADVPVTFTAQNHLDSGTLIMDSTAGSFNAEVSLEGYSNTQPLTMHFFSQATASQ